MALVDDHVLVRAGLAAWLAAHTDAVEVVASAATVAQLLDGPGRGAGVVLLDLNLGDGRGVAENIGALVAAGSRVVVVSENEQPGTVELALRSGALGYVPKSASAEALVEAVVAVQGGHTYMTQALARALVATPPTHRPDLSPQELRTLLMYAGGMPLKSVARRLGITEGAVKTYVDRVREKYLRAGRAAPTKIDLYARAVEDGYLPGPRPPAGRGPVVEGALGVPPPPPGAVDRQ